MKDLPIPFFAVAFSLGYFAYDLWDFFQVVVFRDGVYKEKSYIDT